MWEIRRYEESSRQEWDEFVAASRNSTFLFMRGFMDYHGDRFRDFSLMAYRRGRLAALLPANISDNVLWSHQGLTYGGWLWPMSGLDVSDIFFLWRSWLEFCHSEGIERIIYKPLPTIYHLCPSQEDLYMLFLSGASLIQTDISSAIDLHANPGFNKLQKRHLRHVSNRHYQGFFSVADTDIVEQFHALLSSCLAERHSAFPVHSLEELKLLMSRFPTNIRLWAAFGGDAGDMQAGVLVFESPVCVHCQYIATSEAGREGNDLPYLIKGMVDFYTCSATGKPLRYLDFGISNEDGGRKLNPGLNRQKTSFGASGVACQRFEINVSSALTMLPDSLWKK